MPNYDLGTARGKIDIDARGAKRGSREAKDAVGEYTGGLGDNERQAKDTDRANKDLAGSLLEAGVGAGFLASAVKLIKLPVLIQGITLATGAIGALAGGATALVAGLSPVIGLLPAVAGGALAVAQGVGVAKFALSGIKDGLKDATKAADEFGIKSKEVQEALKDYSPVARELILQLIGMRERFQELRDQAQEQMFPGLISALHTLEPLLNRFRPIVLATALVLGEAAASGARLMASPAFSGQLVEVGNRNVQVLDKMLGALIQVAPALLTIVNAGGPLLVWLTDMVAGWASGIDGFISAADASGRLAAFFAEAQSATTRLFSILGSLAGILGNVGRAAYGTGRDMLFAIDKALEAFVRFTGTVESQTALRDFFESTKAPLAAISGLLGDIGSGLGGLFQSLTPAITPVIEQIRSQFLPVLLDLFGQIDGEFLSAIVTLATEAVEFTNIFLTATPVLTMFVEMLANVVGAANDLYHILGPLGPVVVNMLAAFGAYQTASLAVGVLRRFHHALQIMRLAGLGSVGGLIAKLFTSFRMYGIVGTATAGLWNFAGVLDTITRGVKAVGLALKAAFLANPVGVVVLAIVALGAAVYALYKNFEPFRNFVDAAWQALQRFWDSILNFGGKAIDWFSRVPEMVGGFFSSLPGKIGGAISSLIGKANEIKTSVVDAIVNFFTALPGRIGGFLMMVITTVATWIGSMVTKAMELGPRFIEAILNFLGQLPGRIGFLLGFVIGRVVLFHAQAIQWAVRVGREFIQKVIEFFTQLPGRIWGFLQSAASRIGTFVVAAVAKAREVGSNFLSAVVNFFQQLPGRVGGFLSNVISRVGGWVSQMISNAQRAGSQFLSAIVNFFGQLPGRVAGFLSNAISSVANFASRIPGMARDAATRFVGAIRDGLTRLPGIARGIFDRVVGAIKSMITRAFRAVKDFAAGLWRGFKAGLGISSPSLIEEAMFALTRNVGSSIKDLGRQVRQIHKLGSRLNNIDLGGRIAAVGPAIRAMNTGPARIAAARGAGVGVPRSRPEAPGPTTVDNSRTFGETVVQVETDADPYDISREIAWNQLVRVF